MVVSKSTRTDILLIEDDPDVAEMLADHLEHSLEASVRRACDAEEAFDRCLERTPDLVVADLLLPGENALGFIRRLNTVASIPVILMSGEPTLGRAIEAMRLGVVDLFTKPFDLDRLSHVAQTTLERSAERLRQQRRVRRLRKLAAKALYQRRHLQKQMDLVCRDLVTAHRKLAERVQELQAAQATKQPPVLPPQEP